MRSCGKTGGGRQPIAHRVVAFRPPPSCITSPFSVSGTDGSPSVVPKAPSGRLRAEPAHLSAAALGPSRDPGPGPGAARPPGAAADAGGAQQVALSSRAARTGAPLPARPARGAPAKSRQRPRARHWRRQRPRGPAPGVPRRRGGGPWAWGARRLVAGAELAFFSGVFFFFFFFSFLPGEVCSSRRARLSSAPFPPPRCRDPPRFPPGPQHGQSGGGKLRDGAGRGLVQGVGRRAAPVEQGGADPQPPPRRGREDERDAGPQQPDPRGEPPPPAAPRRDPRPEGSARGGRSACGPGSAASSPAGRAGLRRAGRSDASPSGERGDGRAGGRACAPLPLRKVT